MKDAALHATNVTLFTQVEFKTAGTYYVEVLVDDVMKLRYPVPVVLAPPPNQPPAPPPPPAPQRPRRESVSGDWSRSEDAWIAAAGLAMNASDDKAQFAWQPLTVRGVAAFASATLGRLLLVQFIVALLAAGTVVWFLHRAWFPMIGEAIRQLPPQGEIRSGRLDWPGSFARAPGGGTVPGVRR